MERKVPTSPSPLGPSPANPLGIAHERPLPPSGTVAAKTTAPSSPVAEPQKYTEVLLERIERLQVQQIGEQRVTNLWLLFIFLLMLGVVGASFFAEVMAAINASGV